MEKFKNPLSICLGMIIREAREQRGWDYEVLATKLDMKSSYVKSFENANANLHISKSYNLYTAFSFEALKYNQEFTLEGFVGVLSLISILESIGNEYQSQYLDLCKKENRGIDKEEIREQYYKGIENGCRSIAATNYNYKRLFSEFLKSDVFKEPSKFMTSLIEKNNLCYYVDYFLRYPNSFSKNYEDVTYSLDYYFKSLPTMYTKFLHDAGDATYHLSRNLTFEEIKMWERNNEALFEEMSFIIAPGFDFAVFERITALNYFFSSNCKNVTLYDFKTNQGEALTSLIHNKLTRYAKAQGLSKEKLSRIIGKFTYVQIQEDIWDLFWTDDIACRITWFVKLTNGVIVAFFSDSDFRDDIDVRNLNIGELNSKLKSFRSLEKEKVEGRQK